jgi:hypothetical protein
MAPDEERRSGRVLILNIAIYVVSGLAAGVICLLVWLPSGPSWQSSSTEIWVITCPEAKATAAVAVSRRSRLAAALRGPNLRVTECSLCPGPLTCCGICFTRPQSAADKFHRGLDG